MTRIPSQVLSVCLTLLVLFAIAVPAHSAAPGFSFSGTRRDMPYSGGFAVADFNGDGFPDIAASNASNSVIILLNDGTGHYQQSAALPGSASLYLAAGDFNNDGLIDVAFTTYGSVSIVLGAGDGTLRNRFSIGVAGQGDIKPVDLNGDGKLDLVAGTSPVSFLLGVGDGTLRAPVYFANLSVPFAVTDVNGDGKPDVVGISSSQILSELNLGNGSFAVGPKSLAFTGSALAMAAGDLDGNTTADLVLTTYNPNGLSVFKGNGAGTFTLASTVVLPNEANNVVLLDLNRDGKLDVIYNKVANYPKPATNLIIQLGNGNGTFGPNLPYATGGADYRIALADTSHSGSLDLLTGGSQLLTILKNRGDNTFVQGSYFKLDGVLQSTVSGDFNHDGIRDLVVSIRLSATPPGITSSVTPDTDSQFGGAYVLLGTGNPLSPFTAAQRLFIPPDVINLATADFNKDGNPDLAFVTGDNLVIYLGNGDGTFTPGAQYACSCYALAIADFTSDGNLDIATNGVFLFRGNGDGTFRTPTVPFVAAGRFLLASDANKDGHADLITAVSSTSGFEVALGNGDGTFTLKFPPSPSGLISGLVSDFNGDGIPDFAAINNYDLYVFLGLGGGEFSQTAVVGFGQVFTSDTIAAADFNRDGRVDLVVPGNDFTVFPGKGDGTLAPPIYFGAANFPNVLVAADFYDFGPGTLPDLIGIGQNGAVSFLFNDLH